MSYPFYCPQGHVLEGELTSIGQYSQCPECGASFLVPPPDCGATIAEGFLNGPNEWLATDAPEGVPTAVDLGSGFAVPESPTADSAAAADGSTFDLGFDPSAKSPLPFDLPGQDDSPGDAATLATPAFVAPPPDAAPPMTPPITPQAIDTAGDFLARPSPVQRVPARTAPPPKLLHIRCPAGHVLNASSELLGKLGRCPSCRTTFELRYEDSVEFQRRTENILRCEENERGRAWFALAFVAAFLLFSAMVVIVFMMNR